MVCQSYIILGCALHKEAQWWSILAFHLSWMKRAVTTTTAGVVSNDCVIASRRMSTENSTSNTEHAVHLLAVNHPRVLWEPHTPEGTIATTKALCWKDVILVVLQQIVHLGYCESLHCVASLEKTLLSSISPMSGGEQVLVWFSTLEHGAAADSELGSWGEGCVVDETEVKAGWRSDSHCCCCCCCCCCC